MEEKSIKWVGLRRTLRVAWRKIKVFLPAAVLCGMFFFINHFTLSIQLEGDAVLSLEYGETYQEPGAAVVLSGTLLGDDHIPLPFFKVKSSNDIQLDTLGRYRVMYTSSFFWHELSAERQICIIDTVCPEITFTKDFFDEPRGIQSLIMHGITATDNYDGDITDRVVCSRTSGWVTYSVVDSSGNPAYVVRELPESADQPPEIYLKGDTEYSLAVGSIFEDPGYTAEDIMDGDLTHAVAVEGTVNWLLPGTYSINYSVTDSSGNTASVTRQVHIEAKHRPQVQWPQEKTIYLTFDDGPGPHTMRLLNILDRYDAKATFFVTDTGYNSLMEEIVSRGHSIGIHTVTHNYPEIYADPESYFADLREMQNIIYQNTGVLTTLMRFPGGSSNLVSKKTSVGLMTILSEAVQDAGFQYFDWNVDSDDAGVARKKETVYKNVIDGIGTQDTVIVLQHDIHGYSVDAVEKILKWGQSNGYAFRSLTERSPGFHHDIQN